MVIRNMKKYFSIYLILLKLNYSMILSYRINFINSLISSFIWGCLSFIYIILLTSRTNSIYGWSAVEIILLTASYNVFIGIFQGLFSNNFENIVHIINKGDLDIALIKPADSQFLLSFWYFGYTSFIRIIFGIIAIIVIVSIFNFYVDLFSVFGFIVFGVLGILIIYSIWFILSTFLVWYPQITNIIGFLEQMNGITRYPPEMFSFFSSFVFFFLLPLTFVIATPVKTLIQKAQLYDFLGLIIFSSLLLFISRKFWQFALRHYSSASS